MENEKQSEAEQAQTSATDWSGVLRQAEELAKRIEAGNEEAKKILAQQQELAARKLLGGMTDAGRQPEQPKEESPKEYVERIMSGKK